MTEYKPNSHKYKEENKKAPVERKKLDKVASGRIKEKSELTKFATKLVSPDDVGNIKTYLIEDVIIPTIKNTIWDAFTNSLDMVLFGGTGRGRKKSTAEKISYRNFYERKEDRRRYGIGSETRTRSGYGIEDVILDSRGEAEEVLTRMDEIISEYGIVSVADFYDLVGVTGEYTDNKYGWTNIRNAEPVRARGGGYIIRLPKALPID